MARKLGYATVAILGAIRDGFRYGFQIMERTGLPSGTVYPALAVAKSRGHVEATWEAEDAARWSGRPRRCYYSLTPSGAVALDDAVEQLNELVRRAPARSASALYPLAASSEQ